MPLTTATVTGFMPEPDGVVFDGETVITFSLSKPDVDTVDNATLPPTSISTTLDVSGALSVSLWPNERGSAGSMYVITAKVSDTSIETGERMFRLGCIQVPEVGGDIADLLATGMAFEGYIVSELTQAEYDAVIQAASDAAAAAAAATTLVLRDVTVSTTLALTDAIGGVAVDSASATTVTVPPNSSVAFGVGAQVAILNEGAGLVTVQEGSGVTVKSPDGFTIEQDRIGYLLYRGGDVWVLAGGVS